MSIGLNLYPSCMVDKAIKAGSGQRLASNSMFAWILCGSYECPSSVTSIFCSTHSYHAVVEIVYQTFIKYWNIDGYEVEEELNVAKGFKKGKLHENEQLKQE